MRKALSWFQEFFRPINPRFFLATWVYFIVLNLFAYEYFYYTASPSFGINIFAFFVFCVFPASFTTIAAHCNWLRLVAGLGIAFLFSFTFLVVDALIFQEGLGTFFQVFYSLPLIANTFVGGTTIGFLVRPIFLMKKLKWPLAVFVSIVSVCFALYNLNFLSELAGR